ncbi:MAG: hypothetical protein HY226_00480 [Candidatus Vogelbacteria bacterium]|nr:hypothetical protein [Candidatus Vogelbacteria bacterium]
MTVAGTLLITLFILSYFQGLHSMSGRHSQMMEVKRCLENLISTDDPCLEKVYPDREKAFERAGLLKKLGWAGFKPPVMLSSMRTQQPTPDVGWLDNVYLKESEGNVEVNGWAHHPNGNHNASEVLLVSNGQVLSRTNTGLDRPDVANVFSNTAFLKSGWSAKFKSSDLKSGENVITAYLLIDEQTMIKLNGKGTIYIKDGLPPYSRLLLK